MKKIAPDIYQVLTMTMCGTELNILTSHSNRISYSHFTDEKTEGHCH
jgi:hypothetical protein